MLGEVIFLRRGTHPDETSTVHHFTRHGHVWNYKCPGRAQPPLKPGRSS